MKTHPLRVQLFATVCGNPGSVHHLFLFHTEAHWPLKGKLLGWFSELRDELGAYAMDGTKSGFADFLCDQRKMCRLAYVTGIFGKVNEWNTGLQGKNTHIHQLSDWITGFTKEIDFWKTNRLKTTNESFLQLCKFLADNEIIQPPTQVMAEHLRHTKEQFASFYFDLDMMTKSDWARNPFQCEPDAKDLPAAEIE